MGRALLRLSPTETPLLALEAKPTGPFVLVGPSVATAHKAGADLASMLLITLALRQMLAPELRHTYTCP